MQEKASPNVVVETMRELRGLLRLSQDDLAKKLGDVRYRRYRSKKGRREYYTPTLSAVKGVENQVSYLNYPYLEAFSRMLGVPSGVFLLYTRLKRHTPNEVESFIMQVFSLYEEVGWDSGRISDKDFLAWAKNSHFPEPESAKEDISEVQEIPVDLHNEWQKYMHRKIKDNGTVSNKDIVAFLKMHGRFER